MASTVAAVLVAVVKEVAKDPPSMSALKGEDKKKKKKKSSSKSSKSKSKKSKSRH